MEGVSNTNSENPLVSIGMTVYNAQQFVDLSIQSLLSQDYPNFELIICDNGSQDRTESICRGYASQDKRIVFFRNDSNINPLENAANILRKATGEYHMWAADHDIYHVQFIAKMISQFKKADESVVLCYPDTCRIDINGEPIAVVREDVDTQGLSPVERFKKTMWGLTYCTPIYGLYRMSAVRETWKVRTVTSPDRIYLPELSLKGAFVRHPETLFYMRRNRPVENYRVMKKRQIKWFVINDYEAIVPTIIRDYELIKIAQESNLENNGQKALFKEILKWHHADSQKLSKQEVLNLISHGTFDLQSKNSAPAEKIAAAREYLALIGKCLIFRSELEGDLIKLRRLCQRIVSGGALNNEFDDRKRQPNGIIADNKPPKVEAFTSPEIINDEFYYEIKRLSSTEGIEHILEIGSSTGQGSTSAFAQGINKGGSKAKLYCMEINASRFEQLKRRYETEKGVHCYMSSSVPLDRYPKEKDVVEFYNTTPTALKKYPLEQVLGWLQQDRAYLKNEKVPGNGIQMIKKMHGIKHFDLVLIDGSEFTGNAEMDDVYGANVIMLHDINSYKNYDNYYRLKLDPAYRLEKENWKLRNGYAIFRKIAQEGQSLRRPHVVIDGVIFQHQVGRAYGISRLWRNLVSELKRQMAPIKITVLQREEFVVPYKDMALQIVPAFQWGGEDCLDRDDEMLRRTCHELEADIFISTYYTRAPGVLNLVMVYDLIPELMEMDRSQHEWLSKQRVFETGDGYISISQTTQNDLIKFYPQLINRPMHVAHLGIECHFTEPRAVDISNFRKKYGLHEPYILLVGNRQGYKNGTELLNTIAELQDSEKPSVLCVGGEVQLSPKEKELQDELDIRYVGHLSDNDLAVAYGGAIALFVPSLYEGFGLPVIEAMACGCPVIAHRSPAVVEIGCDAVLYAELSSIRDIRKALGQVKHKTDRHKIVENGIQHAAGYSWSETANTVSRIIMDQVEKKPPMLTAIVSTYNAVRHIRGCLDDLEYQTLSNRLEIVVVDSGSEQDEVSVVRDFQARYDNIKYIRTGKRESVYQAWNRGIRFALGEYISNANTDDRHRKDAYEQLTTILGQNEKIALVYADVLKTQNANETFNECTPSGVFRWPDWDRHKLLTKGCFIGPQPVWRKKVHEIYGYFDVGYKISSDFEYWLRISQTFDFYHIGMPLGLYLDRPDSVEHANNKLKRIEDKRIFDIYQRAAANNQIIGAERTGKVKDAKVVMRKSQKPNLGIDPINETAGTTAEIKKGDDSMNSPDKILIAIQQLVDGGQVEAAQWSMDKLVAEFPDDAELQYQAGNFAYQSGEMDKARVHLEHAVRLAPSRPAFRKYLGDYYYVVEKDAQKAMAQFVRAIELDADNIELLIMVGHIAMSMHQYQDAHGYYQRVLDLEPEHPEIQEIVEKLAKKTTGFHSNSNSGEELHAKAAVKARDGDQQGAIELLEQLLGGDFDQALIHNDLGVLFYESGNMAGAQEHYEKAVNLQPESMIYQKNLADFYLAELFDYERAMAAYVEVLKLDPLDVEAQLSCSQICLALGNVSDARDFINTSLQIEPWNEAAQQLLSEIKNKMDRINSDETPDNTLYEQAQSKASLGDMQGAIQKLRQLIEVSPGNAKVYNDLGVLLYESGDKKASLQCYEKAQMIEPKNHNYSKNLADLYLIELNRTEDAMRLYLSVLEDNPEDVESLMATALICTSIGKANDAKDFYNRVLEIEPLNKNAQNALRNLDVIPEGSGGFMTSAPMQKVSINHN